MNDVSVSSGQYFTKEDAKRVLQEWKRGASP